MKTRGILKDAVMKRFWFASVIVIALAASGCAIDPIQEDVTGFSTSTIVRKIRCETRESVRGLVGAYLSSQPDPVARLNGIELANGTRRLADIDLRQADKNTRLLFYRYSQVAVAYNFSFDAKEINNIGGGTDSVRTFLNGSRSLGLDAGFDRTRQNVQTLTVTDTFADLIYKMKDDYCDGTKSGRNFIYPIAGKIGVDQMLFDFVELSEFGNLGGPSEKPEGPPTMVSTLTFTTALSGSVTPTIMLSPIRNVTRTSGNLLGTVSRTDVHTVIVAFARPAKTLTEVDAIRFYSGQVISPVGTVTQQAALLAIQQYIIRFEVNRPSSIIVNQSILPF